MFSIPAMLTLTAFAAVSLVGAVPSTAGTPSHDFAVLNKRGTGTVSVYYYNDYDSCIASYNDKTPAYQSDTWTVTDSGCFNRLAFPYYTMEWGGSVTLTQACNEAAADGSCGTDCTSYSDQNSGFLCVQTGYHFAFTA